jgi:glutamate N-acetyltransferase/amino-acid N-acetyltransferase
MIVPVPGFRFSAISAGIRKDGRIDTALAFAEQPATVAGLFTRNLVRAAPVQVASARVRSGRARAVLVNAGCANACTGEPGLAATSTSTAAVAKALAIEPELVLPASTGVIGVVLPADRIAARASELVLKLSAEGAGDFATAILTTDRWQKTAETAIRSGGTNVRVLAIGKGAGMIHPDVGPPHATMLVFLFTDAEVEQAELAQALGFAAEDTFNACSVDGDTSTNDTVLALASGASGVRLGAKDLAPAMHELCDALARSMVADGEGSNHMVELRVLGLATDEDARRVARTIATSPLVKTALCGKDPNWGRILGAAGRAGVTFDPNRAAIRVGLVEIVKDGVGLGKEVEAHAKAVMQSPTYSIELVLGGGSGKAHYYMCDLGHGYVDVNADYRS